MANGWKGLAVEQQKQQQQQKKRRKTEIMRTRNSTLLCHLAWLNIKWFSWWWTQSESARSSNVQPLKFRSRVIWYKRVRWLQPFYNVISVIYNIYVRPFGDYFFLFFLLLFVLCSGKMFRGVCIFFLYFSFCSKEKLFFATKKKRNNIQCVFFSLFSLQCERSMCRLLKGIEYPCHVR